VSSLKSKTIFITGSSRGIGRAMALRFAKEGANLIITGKTTEPHAKLEGTIHTVAEEVIAAGGQALAIQLDVREDNAIQEAIEQAATHFGGIDVLINNASAISLTPTAKTALKRFDLMFQVNARATFACSQACLPHLIKADNPHILNIAPPLNMDAKWFKNHVAYTYTKYGMSMCTLGMAAEFAEQKIAVNSLWPATTIATAAVKFNFPPTVFECSRKPEIMADAAYAIISQPSSEVTGHFYTDEQILREQGIEDFSSYMLNPDKQPIPDFYL
jgi:citronellol/citronellal dehydrogenase